MKKPTPYQLTLLMPCALIMSALPVSAKAVSYASINSVAPPISSITIANICWTDMVITSYGTAITCNNAKNAIAEEIGYSDAAKQYMAMCANAGGGTTQSSITYDPQDCN